MKHVSIEVRDSVGILSLNRPDRRNGIGFELAAELRRAAETLADDPSARAVLLRGEGETFCVGGDIREMDVSDHDGLPVHERIALLRDVTRVCETLHTMRKPTVCAMHGAAAGGGLSLALACDLRVAAQSTKITTAFAKIGLSGDFGGTWFLTRLLGAAKARELFLLSPVLSAPEALQLGLVNRVVADDAIQAAAWDLAHGLASGPSAVLAMMKQNLNRAMTDDLGTLLDVEARHQTLSMLTEDHREAARAFLAKRAPVFTGR